MKKSVVGLSLFSGGGIAETYFEDIGIHIAVANKKLTSASLAFCITVLKIFLSVISPHIISVLG